MKKFTVLLVVMCVLIPKLWAGDGCHQRLSPEEFRAKQKAFIIERAGLTPDEAAKFFPIYFELQDRKKMLNDESWEMVNRGKNDQTSEAQYEDIINRIVDNRISIDRLDKTYLDKYKKVLSNKKIYLVQRAEMRFHRELLKEVRRKNKGSGAKR